MIPEKLIEKWRESIINSDHHTAEKIYHSEIFPKIMKDFAAKHQSYTGAYDHLISLVGFSPEPIILTFSVFQPKKVLFLFSKESEKYLDKIYQYHPLEPSQMDKFQIAPSNVESIYEKIKEFVKGKDVSKIAVDITGGKKAMVSGASAAAEFLGCDIFYVDYTDYDPELRKPLPGTEYLNKLKNPAEVFGDFKCREGIRLYQSGSYPQAALIFGEMENKVMHKSLYEIYTQLMYFYENWENYKFDSAVKYGEKVLSRIDQFRICENLAEPMRSQLDIVKRLKEKDQSWLVCNHYFMANRFAGRKRFDFAALLLYRTIEMALCIRLKDNYQIEASEPDYSQYSDLYKKYQDVARSVIEIKNKIKENLPSPIGFMDAALLLSALEDDFIQKDQLKKLYGQSKIRNDSVLAHGTSPIDKKQFEKMRDTFTIIFKKFITNYLPEYNIKTLQQLFNPVTLDQVS